MSEIKNSIILEKVFEHAKELNQKINPVLTAERFFVSLIDIIMNTGDDIEEFNEVKSIVDKIKIDLVATRKVLLEHVNKNNDMAFMDGIYMQKKMYEAKTLAEEMKKKEVTPALLLTCILADPSEPIKNILIDEVSQHTSSSNEDTKGNLKDELTLEDVADVLGDLFKSIDESVGEAKDKEVSENHKVNSSVSKKEEISLLVEDIKRIQNELSSSVFGQDNAINVFTTGYFQANMLSMIDKSRKRPKATFLFAGPPGVGKTFLAEKAAEALKLPFMRFDMSEYADKEANLEFCGSDKVYKNAKPGNVTSFVANYPKCVLLFDEIEKAHKCVIHLFLQMLDAGRLRDNHTDEEVSFSDAIIILTTNAGKQLYEDSVTGDFSNVSRKVIVKALQKDVNPETGIPYFPDAICSRFASGNVVMFNHISVSNLKIIAKKEIERHAKNLKAETNITLSIDEKVYTALLLSEGASVDARTIRGRAETFFNDELHELLRLIASKKVKTGVNNVEKIKITVDLSKSKNEISSLFESTDLPRILIFAETVIVELCKEKLPTFDIVGVNNTTDAIREIKNNEFGFVLVDPYCGVDTDSISNLNIEDVDSPARDFYKFVREQRNCLPIYLLESNGLTIADEEKISFIRQGVRGIVRILKGKDKFSTIINDISNDLYQQESMAKLARENKLVSFETAQSISKSGKNAEIKLFDFDMAVAIDSEDKKNVLSAVSKPDVRFDEVLGAKDAKKELEYFVEYLKNPKKYIGTGVKAPKGILLYGPPGTGKTMLAKAMASESDVTFIAAEGNQFLKQYIGEGPEKVHQLFKTARKYAPSILFIDEIDAIAKERQGTTGGVEETLTAFLTEMDGFVNDASKPVFVLAATNFDVEPGSEKSLDPALMRRFDRRIYIELPGKEDRVKFMQLKIAKNSAFEISEEQISNIAIRSTGMSLAELDSAMELALRSSIREGSTKVTDAIFEDAFETFSNGETKKWDASQLERVARHEAGHAFMCWYNGETPSYLTIVARGNHGGYMQHADHEGKAIYTKDELLAKINTSLGGRAAEIAYYGEKGGISTGASGDLISATNVARQILCTYGMDDSFGLAVVPGDVASNGNMSLEVREAVNRILKEQMNDTIKIISENKDKIEALVEELMVKNHLSGTEIEKVIEREGDKEVSRITNAD